jgi:hypothetical protein
MTTKTNILTFDIGITKLREYDRAGMNCRALLLVFYYDNLINNYCAFTDNSSHIFTFSGTVVRF